MLKQGLELQLGSYPNPEGAIDVWEVSNLAESLERSDLKNQVKTGGYSPLNGLPVSNNQINEFVYSYLTS